MKIFGSNKTTLWSLCKSLCTLWETLSESDVSHKVHKGYSKTRKYSAHHKIRQAQCKLIDVA